MTRAPIPVLLFLLMAAAPLRGQVVTPADTAAAPPVDTLAVPAPPDTAAVEAPTPAVTDTVPPAVEEAAEDAADAVEEAAEAEVEATHDWEFALKPGVVQATGVVEVTEGEANNSLHISVQGLPPVDSLSQEGRVYAGYTVWLIPSKERWREGTLLGTLTVGTDGAGQFEATTDLDTFGILIAATAEPPPVSSGELTQRDVVASAIPVTQAAPAEEPADETPDDVETPDEPPAEEPAPPPPGQAR